jgi:hypothetical protein
MVTENNTEGKHLLTAATETNTKIWSEMLWLLGGNLNWGKCFYYYLESTVNYTSGTIHNTIDIQ